MAIPQEGLSLQGLVGQPDQTDIPELTTAPAKPASRSEQYAKFMADNPNLRHIPFEVWDTEASQMQSEGAARMEATRKQMAFEGAQGQGSLGAQLMSPIAAPASARELAQLYNIPVSSFVESTQLPKIAGAAAAPVGQLVDIAAGTTAPGFAEPGKYEQMAQQVGAGLPRGIAAAAGGPIGFAADVGAQSLAGGRTPLQSAGDVAAAFAIGKLGQVGGVAGEQFVGKQITQAMRPTAGDTVAQAVNRQLAEKALTGIAPKVGQVVGQAAGVTAGSVGAQLVEGQNPLAPESLFQTAANVAMMGGPNAVRMMANSSAYNTQASKMLGRWWVDKQTRQPGQPSLPETAAEQTRVMKMIDESSSIPDNDLPSWRNSMVVRGFNDMSGQSPEVRQAVAQRLARAVVESRDLDAVNESSVRTAYMMYLDPPRTVDDLTATVRRINVLKQDALKVLDERLASGEESMSAAAVKQLFDQGYITRKIDHNWMMDTFGEGFDRSLLNSNATAYSVMVQKMANELLIMGLEGAKARGTDLRKKSIAALDTSRRTAADQATVSRFFEMLGKIPDEYQYDPEVKTSKLKYDLWQRFLHHEQNDQQYDTGEGNKYMSEISDVIDGLTSTRPEGEWGQIDWQSATVSRPRTVRTVDEETGAEKESQSFKDTSLGGYLAKDFEGKYTQRVYGRSSRSQKEVVMSQAGITEPRALEKKGQEALSEQEMYGVPGEKASVIEQVPAGQPEVRQDWSTQADLLRGYLQNTDSEELWRTVAPAFVSPGRTTVHGKTEARFKPIIKDLAQAMFEGGVVAAGQAKDSPAAEALVQKLGLAKPAGRSAASVIDSMVFGSVKQSGRTTAQLRDEMFQRLAGAAGLDVPGKPAEARVETSQQYSTDPRVTNPFIYRGVTPGEKPTLLKGPPLESQTLGASGGMGGMADAYVIFTQSALAQAVDPATAERIAKLGMTMVNAMNADPEVYMRLTKYQYTHRVPSSTKPGELEKKPILPGETPEFKEMSLAGILYPGSSTFTSPIIGLAHDHIDKNPLASWMLLSVMAHETTHALEIQTTVHPRYLAERKYPFNGAYTHEQHAAYRALEAFRRTLSTEQREVLLTTLAEVCLPKAVRDNPEAGEIVGKLVKYGAYAEEKGYWKTEFTNVAMQFITAGLINGETIKLGVKDVFEGLPDELSLFIKAQYRNVLFNLEAVKGAINSPDFAKTQAGQLFAQMENDQKINVADSVAKLVHLVNKMVVAKDLAVAQAEVGKLFFNLKNINAESLMTPFFLSDKPLKNQELMGLQRRLKPLTAKEITEASDLEMFRRMSTAINDTFILHPEVAKGSPNQPWPKDEWLIEHELATGGESKPPPKVPRVDQLGLPFPEEDKKPTVVVHPGLVVRSLMLTNQALDFMSRRGLPLAQNSIHAIMELVPAERRMTLSMFAPFMTKNGKFDPENPAVLLRQDNSAQGVADRAWLNKIVGWAQKNEEKPFEQNGQGQWVFTESAIKDGLGGSSGTVPARVVDSFNKLTDSMKLAGQHILDSQMQSVSYRVARMAMSMHPSELNPLGYDQALGSAQKLVRGLLYGDQRLAVDGLENMIPATRESVMLFLNGGVMKGLQDLRSEFDRRGEFFVTEQRPGKYIVKGVDEKGKTASDGADDMIQVNRLKQMYEAKGYKQVEVISKSEAAKYAKYDSPEGILNRYIDAEQEYWETFLASNPKGLSEEQLQALRAFAPAIGTGVAEQLQQRSVSKFLIKRRLVPTVAGMDYFDNIRDYIPRLASTIARRETRQKVELILADSRMKGQDPAANYIRDSLNASLYPSQSWERNMQAFTAGYFMAANLSSMVVNGADIVTVLPEVLISKGQPGYGSISANQQVGRAIGLAAWANMKGNQGEIERMAKTVSQEMADAAFAKRPERKFTPDEIRAYAAYHAVQLQQIDSGLMHDVFEHQDFKALAARAFGTGNKAPTAADLVSDPLYRSVRVMMTIPRLTHSFNNWTAYFAGLEQGIEQGMGPREAMNHADLVRTLALFTGGKTNAPGYMGRYFKGSGLSTVRVLHTMQQYTTGVLGRYYSNLADSLSNDPNLTEAQRVQARKAMASLTFTQLALAGLLGLPLVGATMKILADTFNTNPEADLRKGLAYLAGADKDPSGFRGVVTELAMNGIPNQAFGINLGPRLGTSEALGFSTYDGFNLLDMAAGSSIVKKMYDGLGYLAQGEPYKAATSLAPNFLRRVATLAGNKAQYGDFQFRNQQGKPIYDPSLKELFAYSTGFDPSRLSEAMRRDRLISESDKIYERNRNREVHKAAVAQLQGNNQPTYDWVRQQLQADPSIALRNPTGPAKVVADKAAELRQVQDPLATSPLGNATEAKAIAQSFPTGLTERRSELQATIDRIRQEAGVGVLRGNTADQLMRASIIDSLTKQGLTRAEAEQRLRILGL